MKTFESWNQLIVDRIVGRKGCFTVVAKILQNLHAIWNIWNFLKAGCGNANHIKYDSQLIRLACGILLSSVAWETIKIKLSRSTQLSIKALLNAFSLKAQLPDIKWIYSCSISKCLFHIIYIFLNSKFKDQV